MLCKVKSLLTPAVSAGAPLNLKLCLLKFKETILRRAVYSFQEYQQKLRASMLLVISLSLCCPFSHKCGT